MNELGEILATRWQTLEEFTNEPNEGWCWIVYKGRVVEACHDHEGMFRFHPNSRNVYLSECITFAQAMVMPDRPGVSVERYYP